MNDTQTAQTQTEETVTIAMPDTGEAVSEPTNSPIGIPIVGQDHSVMEQTPILPQPPIVEEVKKNDILPVIKPKHAGGRPCELCSNEKEVMDIVNAYKNKALNARKTDKPFMPYIEDLALDLKKDDGTLVDWAKKMKEDGTLEHPEFTAAYFLLKTCQKLFLLKRTLGRYNAVGAMFQLKVNHGLIETEKKLLGNADDKELRITIVEEEK